MSMTDTYPNGPQQQGGGSVMDAITQLQAIARNLSLLVEAFNGRFVFGNFTLAAAATTVVPTTSVAGNSRIIWLPTNAAAATLEGSAKCLYQSAISPGVSFTLATASGVAAAGTETFNYLIQTPS